MAQTVPFLEDSHEIIIIIKKLSKHEQKLSIISNFEAFKYLEIVEAYLLK